MTVKKKKIKKILTIGTNLKTSEISSDLSSKYDEIYSAIGIHPNEVINDSQNIFKIKNIYKKNIKNIAYGETGLDYHFSKDYRLEQLKLFEKHINFAQEDNSTVIVHTRDAETDTAAIIDSSLKFKKVNFLIHCFTGTIDFAKKLLNMGCYISFSGIITFKNSHDLQNVVKYIPLDRILIETDSPYLSPDPYRGKNNSPINLEYVAKKVAEIKKISYEKVGILTSNNFYKIFNL